MDGTGVLVSLDCKAAVETVGRGRVRSSEGEIVAWVSELNTVPNRSGPFRPVAVAVVLVVLVVVVEGAVVGKVEILEVDEAAEKSTRSRLWLQSTLADVLDGWLGSVAVDSGCSDCGSLSSSPSSLPLPLPLDPSWKLLPFHRPHPLL